MNRNMRKMYTEEQIGEIAKSSVSGGTKLYQHHLESTDQMNWLDVILSDNVELTDAEHYNEILVVGKQFLSGSGYHDNDGETLYGIYAIEIGETITVSDLSGNQHSFSDLTDTVTPL